MVVYGNVLFNRNLAQTFYKHMSNVLVSGVKVVYLIDGKDILYFEAEVDSKHSRRTLDGVVTGQMIAPVSDIIKPSSKDHKYSQADIEAAKAVLNEPENNFLN